MRARANLFTRGLSYIDSNFIYHVYARKASHEIHARTHLKFTRQWKSTFRCSKRKGYGNLPLGNGVGIRL